jgi:hypothetical protein
VVERGIAAIARHPKVPVSITGGSCSFADFIVLGFFFVNVPKSVFFPKDNPGAHN